MSFKGLKATIKINKIEEFKMLLTEGKEDFDGVLYYDEQGYSNNYEDMTFGDSKTYIVRGARLILPEDNKNLKNAIIRVNKKEIIIEEEGDQKTVVTPFMIDDGLLLCSLYEEYLIGERCQVLYKGKIFNAIIKYIGPSCS